MTPLLTYTLTALREQAEAFRVALHDRIKDEALPTAERTRLRRLRDLAVQLRDIADSYLQP